jgi:hypothetical protein
LSPDPEDAVKISARNGGIVNAPLLREAMYPSQTLG